MKALLLLLTFAAAPALAQSTVFENSRAEVRIDTSPAATPIRNEDFVTFAATVTFKAPAREIAAGTRAYIYWTVDCRRGLERQVVSWVEVPGKPRSGRTLEQLVKTAKQQQFEAPTDDLTREVIASVCSTYK